MRRALRQMQGVFGELERATVVARMREGKRQARAQGKFVGGKPLHRRYGYVIDDGRYVPVPAEQKVIDRMAELRAAPLKRPYRAIATALDREGFASPTGGDWGATTVRKILVREDKP